MDINLAEGAGASSDGDESESKLLYITYITYVTNPRMEMRVRVS